MLRRLWRRLQFDWQFSRRWGLSFWFRWKRRMRRESRAEERRYREWKKLQEREE